MCEIRAAFLASNCRHTPRLENVDWDRYMHDAPDSQDLAAIRRSLNRTVPLGSAEWIDGLAKELNSALTIRPHGRPRKKEP